MVLPQGSGAAPEARRASQVVFAKNSAGLTRLRGVDANGVGKSSIGAEVGSTTGAVRWPRKKNQNRKIVESTKQIDDDVISSLTHHHRDASHA